jgi:seryl-tRNA synthetase
MFDINWIRHNPDLLDQALASRGEPSAAARVLALDDARRSHVTRLQELQERRNTASKDIGKAKAGGDEDLAARLIAQVAEFKQELQQGQADERRLTGELEAALSALPNAPLATVPVGPDESANELVRQGGDKPEFTFRPLEHFSIGEKLGLMDFEVAAKLSGSRFVVLTGALARLERALGQFMLDLHTGEHGYTEVAPPVLVRDEALFGTAQLPKFADDQFRTEDGRWLIPTAEVPLTNLVAQSILDEAKLPMRVTALTACFRSEAGSAGRDVRGMLRQHQFSKVELVSITTPQASRDELERMLGCAEQVLKLLGLHYRIVTLATGDMGFAAQLTYDIEVWLPGQGAYREISSCSMCGEFQARRMNARYRAADAKRPQFVHTLNGSGIAVGRALIAVLETFQEADGSVRVPDILRPYMNNIERISVE